MMKKTYSRPDIYFEDFSLSTNIATSCEKTPFNHIEMCGVKLNRVDVLFDGGEYFKNCTIAIKEGDNPFDNLCYHNPTADENVFFS